MPPVAKTLMINLSHPIRDLQISIFSLSNGDACIPASRNGTGHLNSDSSAITLIKPYSYNFSLTIFHFITLHNNRFCIYKQ